MPQLVVQHVAPARDAICHYCTSQPPSSPPSKPTIRRAARRAPTVLKVLTVSYQHHWPRRNHQQQCPSPPPPAKSAPRQSSAAAAEFCWRNQPPYQRLVGVSTLGATTVLTSVPSGGGGGLRGKGGGGGKVWWREDGQGRGRNQRGAIGIVKPITKQ